MSVIETVESMAAQAIDTKINGICNGKVSSQSQTNELENYERLVCDNTTTERTAQGRSVRSVLADYLIALRPWSFTASITPVALGSGLAYKSTGSFDPFIFLTTVFTALSVHAAGNLVNTYYDYMRGIDNKKSDDRTLVDKRLSPQDVAWFGGFFYICGCVGCLILTLLSSARMEHLALVYFCGLSSSFLYTGGLGLKYVALGDVLIVFTFGPLTVVFAFLAQAGQLTLLPFLYAIPLALNTEAILHSNNARDMDSDRTAGIITLAILLGPTGSYAMFCALLFIPYIMFILMGLHLSLWMALPVFTIFLAFRLEKDFRRKELLTMPQSVAKLNLLVGVLYTAACLLCDNDSLPSLLKNSPSVYSRS